MNMIKRFNKRKQENQKECFKKRIETYKNKVESATDITEAHFFTTMIYGAGELAGDLGLISDSEKNAIFLENLHIYQKQIDIIKKLQKNRENNTEE